MPFKVGDLVQIKSGGPPMTVQEVVGDSVTCIWYVGDKYYRTDYDAAILKAAATDETGPH